MLPTTRTRRYENSWGPMPADVDRMLQRWWSDVEDSPVARYPVDIREDADHLYIDAELPGYDKDQVEVTLENNVLTIQAERKLEQHEGEQHLQERRFTRVSRSFTVPKTVDENKVDAKLSDGVLHLTLHKREEIKPRKIQVS